MLSWRRRLRARGPAVAGAPIASSSVSVTPLRCRSTGGSSVSGPLLSHPPVAAASFGGRERPDDALKLSPGLRKRCPKVFGVVSLEGEGGHVDPQER
jgi:hypothetical protein